MRIKEDDAVAFDRISNDNSKPTERWRRNPDENNIKQLLAAVFDHLLELRAVVRFGRECTVNVVLDDRDAVLFRIGRAFPNLPLDRFFALVIR